MPVLAQRHKQPVSHATAAFRAATFQPEGALVTLLQVETNFDSHSFVTLRVLQPLTTVWETGRPRPSDNLLFQRTMAGYFPITGDCFCLYYHRMFYVYEIMNMLILAKSYGNGQRADKAALLSKLALKASILLSN